MEREFEAACARNKQKATRNFDGANSERYNDLKLVDTAFDQYERHLTKEELEEIGREVLNEDQKYARVHS